MFKVYDNVAPKYLCQKFFETGSPMILVRASSSRFQFPLPKTNYGKKSILAIGAYLFGTNCPRICVNANL